MHNRILLAFLRSVDDRSGFLFSVDPNVSAALDAGPLDENSAAVRGNARVLAVYRNAVLPRSDLPPRVTVTALHRIAKWHQRR